MSYIANHHKKSKASGCLIPFFAIFGLAGFGVLIGVGIIPLLAGEEIDTAIFAILFSLPFIGIGVGGIVYCIRSRTENPHAHLDDKATSSRDKHYNYGDPQFMEVETELHLKSGSPLGRIIATGIFAAIWNGGTSIPIFSDLIPSFQSGNPDWGLCVFIGIFALIGLGLLMLVLYYVLAYFNPRPSLTLHSNHMRIGETVRLQYELSGNVYKISNLRLVFKGIESASYRRGTDTVTTTETFYEAVVTELTDSVDMRSGTVELNIPSNSMPSWESNNNKILWRLELHGDIPRWPDIDEKYEFTVYPERTR